MQGRLQRANRHQIIGGEDGRRAHRKRHELLHRTLSTLNTHISCRNPFLMDPELETFHSHRPLLVPPLCGTESLGTCDEADVTMAERTKMFKSFAKPGGVLHRYISV